MPSNIATARGIFSGMPKHVGNLDKEGFSRLGEEKSTSQIIHVVFRFALLFQAFS